MTTTDTLTQEQLASMILAELTAVMGPLRSTHLDRNLNADDVLDAIHVATDDAPVIWPF